jgi:hypothetical protein
VRGTQGIIRLASSYIDLRKLPRKHSYHPRPPTMKPTSPLSLLLFLHLVSAIPIPTRHSFTPSDCQYSSCAPSLRTAFILSKPNTPPTKLSEPHFPSHQLSSKKILDEIYDNTPRTPPKTITPTAALSAKHPLSSSYLLSLANALHPDTTTPLPSKPTSELPNLRKEDAQRYWASLRDKAASQAGVTVVELQAPSHTIKLCGHGQEQYLKIQGAYLAREYSDLMVVGIVVLFLAVVVAMEACERVDDLWVLPAFILNWKKDEC